MDLLANKDIKWTRFTGDDRFDYPIDYSGSLLNLRDDGHIELLYKWEPNHFCHFHRHVAPISSLILDGELHITEYEDGKEVVSKIRKAGDYSHDASIHDHMEMGGPDGALVLFTIYSPDGKLTQQLAEDGTILNTITKDDIQSGRLFA